MTLTVKDLVTKLGEFADDQIVEVRYKGIVFPIDKTEKGIVFPIDKIEKCEVTDNVMLIIGLDISEDEESEDEE
jgi:hypothetical protein